MGRMLPIDCHLCDGVVDWGDFGSENEKDNKPTCKCVDWYFDESSDSWEWRKSNTTWKSLCEALYEAVTDEGANPRFHRQVMAGHRREWPVLWKVIDKIVKQYEKEKK